MVRICSSTWLGNTLTPRTIIMSSVRPVTFSLRRKAGYAVAGRSPVKAARGGGRVRRAREQPGEVAGAVAHDRHRLLGQPGEDQLALLAVRQHLVGDGV